MGWRIRGKKRYYYQMVRSGRRVGYRYLGAGPSALLAAEEVARRKSERVRQEAEVQALRELACSVSGLTGKLATELNLLVNGLMLVDGWHLHHRSEWRKRRDRN